MTKKEIALRSLQNKTDEEKLEILANKYNLNWSIPDGDCKIWFAKVFTYCTADELEDEINFFLFLVSILACILNLCFREEDTVFLGCTCPRGSKQAILYYSLKRRD
ncbi:hypothetical protein SDC9_90793 [bioreactor metagenome]|uniref:Uncharacterized protein n=1 Tax=bioreactor metagenome TaxID=1076179 RepID=A0A644ZTA3_9ZZZZ|nr:hypothetical protein [Candidatus Metalachnospira sp.]